MHSSVSELLLKLNVPRETYSRLNAFVNLVMKWNKAISIISQKDESHVWERHVLDSLQLCTIIQPTSIITDFGSGGGFPGLVLSLLPYYNIHLIERDQRKAAFLKVASELSLSPITVHNDDIRSSIPWETDYITARALSQSIKLLDMAYPFCNSKTRCIFLKGQNIEDELAVAKQYYRFSMILHKSITSHNGTILELYNIHKI